MFRLNTKFNKNIKNEIDLPYLKECFKNKIIDFRLVCGIINFFSNKIIELQAPVYNDETSEWISISMDKLKDTWGKQIFATVLVSILKELYTKVDRIKAGIVDYQINYLKVLLSKHGSEYEVDNFKTIYKLNSGNITEKLKKLYTWWKSIIKKHNIKKKSDNNWVLLYVTKGVVELINRDVILNNSTI